MHIKYYQEGMVKNSENATGRDIPSLLVDGGIKLLYNMRYNGECFEGLRRADAGGFRVAHRVIAGDRRDNATNILGVETVADGVRLYWEGVHTADDQYEERGEMICLLPAEVEECCGVGEFLVLRLADKSLYFILWESDVHDYSWLGGLPSLPKFSVKAEKVSAVTQSIEAMEFKNAVEDFRSGVPTSVSTMVENAVTEAWNRGVSSIRNEGCFAYPVMVRVGLRLWDGSLYALSDSVNVEDMDYPSVIRGLFPLVKESKGYTGTAATDVSVDKYTLTLKLENSIDAAWESVVRSVDVYVSDEQSILSGIGSVSYNSGSDKLSCVLEQSNRATLAQNMEYRPMRKVLSLPVSSVGSYTLYNKVGIAAKSVSTVTPPAACAEHIASHGGFLHIAGTGVVSTMRRGNPLVTAGSTMVGDTIAWVEAQPTGGGAYTRQYLYIFADKGVYALTHDYEGKHTNCRPVSMIRVDSGARVAPSDEGVWALSMEGTLVLFKDCSVEGSISGMCSAESVMWHQRLKELWICSSQWGVSLVLQKDKYAYFRSIVPSVGLSRNGDIVYLLPHAEKNSGGVLTGYTTIHFLGYEPAGQGSDCDTAVVVIEEIRGGDTGNALLSLGMYGTGVDATVDVEVEYPLRASAAHSFRTRVTGNVKRERLMAVRLPIPSDYVRDFTPFLDVTITGVMPSFYGVKVLSGK